MRLFAGRAAADLSIDSAEGATSPSSGPVGEVNATGAPGLEAVPIQHAFTAQGLACRMRHFRRLEPAMTRLSIVVEVAVAVPVIAASVLATVWIVQTIFGTAFRIVGV